jgi:hypothetical protein
VQYISKTGATVAGFERDNLISKRHADRAGSKMKVLNGSRRVCGKWS